MTYRVRCVNCRWTGYRQRQADWIRGGDIFQRVYEKPCPRCGHRNVVGLSPRVEQ